MNLFSEVHISRLVDLRTRTCMPMLWLPIHDKRAPWQNYYMCGVRKVTSYVHFMYNESTA